MRTFTKLLLAILVLVSISVSGQKTFIKHFGTGESEYGTSLSVSNSTGILLGQIVPNNGEIYFGLVKTDLNGKKIWSRVYKNRYINIIKSIKSLSSGYIILGTSWDNASSHYKLELMQINSDGDIVWAKEYTSSNADLASGLVIYNNQIFITGVSDYNYSGQYPKLFWLKTDANGMPLSSKLWTAPYGLKPVSMAVNALGKFSIACESNSFGIGMGSFLNVIHVQLDENGTIEWSNSFGTDYDDEVGAITSDNNDWLITGRSYFVGSNYDMMLLKINQSGNLVWGNFYDAATSSGEAGRSVISTGSNYVIAGDAGTFDERNMNLTSISQSGAINWSMEYPLSPLFTNYPFEVVALSNNDGYVFTGDFRPPSSFRDAALIRTNSTGDAGCFSTPFSFNTRTATIEELPVVLTPLTFTQTDSSMTWQEQNIVIDENKICAFPTADFSYQADTLACPNYCYNFQDLSINATTWNWNFTNGTPSFSTLQDPGLICFDTISPGTYEVRLIVSDGIIPDTMIQNIVITSALCDTVDTAIFIPNVITPNGDFRNDQFIIKNLPDNFKLIIYNRWGNEVFTTTSKTKMWPEKPLTDNTHEGVYYYVLKITEPDRTQEFHGNFSVILNKN